MAISRCLSSSETLTPSTLAALALMMATAVSIARVEIGGAPVAGERRIEHVAEPMDDHGLAHLRQHAAIDLGVVVGAAAELASAREAIRMMRPPAFSIAAICSS